MRLSADDAVIPCSSTDGLSVEASIVLIHISSSIQVHKACTVHVRPSADLREEVGCRCGAAHLQ